MKIVVTGGAGFIGGNFIHYMLKEHADEKIICVDALTYAGNLETLEPVMKNKNFNLIKTNVKLNGNYYEFNINHNSKYLLTKSKIDSQYVTKESNNIVDFQNSNIVNLLLIICGAVLILVVVIIIFILKKKDKKRKVS